MEGRVKQTLLLLWRITYPVILYEAVTGMVTIQFVLFQKSSINEETRLMTLGVSALLASVPLGWLYRRQRTEAAGGGGFPLGRLMLAGAGACVCLNHALLMLPVSGDSFAPAKQVIYGAALPIQLLCTGLAIPLAEELVFRGLGYGQLRREMPFFSAAVSSAVWFGLFHGTLLQGIYACLMGMLLALVYERTNRLLAAWTFHGAANVTSIVFTALGLNIRLQQSPLLMGMAAVLGGLLLFFAMWNWKPEDK